MGFWNLFTKKTTPAIPAEQTGALQPEAGQEQTEKETDKQEANGTIPYATSMPIDLIYAYLKEDYETRGYEDALCNPDNTYKEINKSLIRSNLEILFKQVSLRYVDDLRDIEFHIQSRTEAGLLDVVEQLKSRKDTYEQHLTQLKGMDADLQHNVPYMVGMMVSYERGFLRGLAAISLGTLKK